MNTIIFNADEEYELDWLTDRKNFKAQIIFEQHYQSPIRPRCHCLTDSRNRELVVKKRTRFFLAKFPGTGENHADTCNLHGATSFEATNQKRKSPAIIERGDKLNVKISSYLDLASITPAGNTIIGNYTRGMRSRGTVTLLGLLNVCLQKSGIHVWQPVRKYLRTFNTVQKSVDAIAEHITIGRRQLSSMLVMPRWQKGLDRVQNLEQNSQLLFRKTAKSGEAAIVIGVVNRWIVSNDNGSVRVGLNLLDNLLWMPSETAVVAEISFGQLIKEIKLDDRHILAIATVFRNKKFFKIADISLMRTNRQFIPVDSPFELVVADKLIANNRKFRKPLRLEGEKYLPDFVLMDCNSDWVMEVFGVQGNSEYDAQKMLKINYYEKNQIPCWKWTPAEDDDMPDFPTAQPKA